MSVITAVLRNGSFAMASDSLAVNGNIQNTVKKIKKVDIHQGFEREGVVAFEPGFIGCTGALCAIQRMMNVLTKGLAEKAGIEDALQQAFQEILPYCGATPPGEYPSIGIDVLLVSKTGIWKMDRCGAIIHIEPVDATETIYTAIGIGAECALGRMDAYYGDYQVPIGAVANLGADSACRHIHGCKLPVQSLYSDML
jgi:hypothetical protein